MKLTLSIVALAALVVACVPAQQTLRVSRFTVMAGINDFDAFDRTIADETSVRELSAAIDALPPARANTFCPIAFGLRYSLDFKGATTRTVVVEGDGCRLAHLSPTDVRATNEAFWAQLAGALGLYTRGNDLFPLPKGMHR